MFIVPVFAQVKEISRRTSPEDVLFNFRSRIRMFCCLLSLFSFFSTVNQITARLLIQVHHLLLGSFLLLLVVVLLFALVPSAIDDYLWPLHEEDALCAPGLPQPRVGAHPSVLIVVLRVDVGVSSAARLLRQRVPLVEDGRVVAVRRTAVARPGRRRRDHAGAQHQLVQSHGISTQMELNRKKIF